MPDSEQNLFDKKSNVYLILVILYVKILRNGPFDKFVEKDVATVICVDYVELCK